MITSMILNLLYYVLLVITYPIALFPDVTLPASVTSAITTLFANLSIINDYFPLDQLMLVFGAFLFNEFVLLFGYKLAMWVLKKIPFIN